MQISINVLTLVIQIVNFSVLFLVLKKVLYEPMVRAIGERQARIRKELDEAEAINREAQALKEQYDSKLRNVQQEAAGLVASANQEGERRKSVLVDEGRAEAHHLLEKGRTELSREQQQVLSDLRGRVVEISVDMATRLFRDTLTPEQHSALVAQFLKKAEKLNVG